MRTRRVLPTLMICLLVAGLMPSAQPSSAARAQTDLVASLRAQTDGHLRVAYHAETGKARFIGTERAHPLPRPAALSAGAAPTLAARQFLGDYGALFGLRDQAQELTVMREVTGEGRSFVRFQQVYQGIPILGGELIVQVDQARNIVSANGEVLPDLNLDIQPRIDAATARAHALEAIAAQYGVAADTLIVSTPELWVFNPALLGGPGLRRNTLTWRMEVRGESATTVIRELVLIDAQVGMVVLHFNQIADAKSRRVCNADNVVDPDSNEKNDCNTDAKAVRLESDPATGNVDVDRAYDYSGDTYDYYFNNFGRDSLDGNGLKLVSLVKYCPDSFNCPYGNAFWDGQQMTYGDGYATADDVVGHELTHGFTEFTSHLFYYYQAGAINESLSDVFGELIDQGNGKGNDAPGVRWQMGEDLPIGAIRNMATPGAFNDPDRTGSPNYYGGESDSGGVHSNSGVNNKAAFLMTDGGVFNDQTITGLGAAKVGQIYYKVETSLLTSSSDYQDLGDALPTACDSLVGQHGITADDCAQVREVVLATEMDKTPTSAPATDVAVCPTGTPADLFFDDLENLSSGNWTSSATVGANGWYYPQNPNPTFVGDATYATSGEYNFFGFDVSGVPSDYHIRMTKSVQLPAGAFMHFKHAYGFDDQSGNGDGSVVEYSTDGGTSWQDAGPLFEANGYNGSISSSSNPLNERQAFVGESNGYISSRINLSTLQGQSVRFRFRIGTNNTLNTANDYGWFIDDVQIYTCTGLAELNHRSFLPLVQQPAPPPSGPTPGFWASQDGDEFYVTADRANVATFALYIGVENCGNFKITHSSPAPIVDNQFSFAGAFYGSGAFTSSTITSGTDGLDDFPIEECGGLFTGEWNYAATWQNSSQPAIVQRSGPITVESLEAIKGRYIVTRVK